MQAAHSVHLTRAKHSSLLPQQDSSGLTRRTASTFQWNSTFACILLPKAPNWQCSIGYCSSTATASHTSSNNRSSLKQRCVHAGSTVQGVPALTWTSAPQCSPELGQQAQPHICLQQEASAQEYVDVISTESQATAAYRQKTVPTADKPQSQIALQAADAHRGKLPQQQQQQKQPVPRDQQHKQKQQQQQQQQQPSELVASAVSVGRAEAAESSQLGYTAQLVHQQQQRRQATAPLPESPEEQHQHSRRQQQQQQNGRLQEQLQQLTHWRQLLPLSTALRTVADLIAVLKAALLLQPAGAAASSAGLAAEQQLFEQQHFHRYLVFLLKTAAALLASQAPKSRAGAGADAGAGACSPVVKTQAVSPTDVIELLGALASTGSHMQQSLHPQLQQLPIHHVIQRQRGLWLPGQALQVVTQMAVLWPHIRSLPVPRQEQLCHDVLHPATARTRQQGSQRDQQGDDRAPARCSAAQEQKQSHVAAADAAYLLWAAARLGWRMSDQHKQRAVTAVLGCLTSLTRSELAAALWGCAQLEVSAAQLQHSWQEVTRPAAGWYLYEQRLVQVLGSLYTQQATQQVAQVQQGNHVQQQPRSAHQQMNAQQASRQTASPQQQQQPPGVSVVLGALLRHHCSQFTARELVGVVWAAGQLRVLSQPSVLRDLLGALVSPEVVLGLTDEDICSVLWSLARMQQRLRDSARLLAGRAQVQHTQQEKKLQQQQQQRDGQAMQGWALMPEEQKRQQQKQKQQKRRQRAAAHASMLQQQPVRVPEDLVLRLLQAYQVNLPTCSSSNLARTLWSLSFIQVKPPRSWVVGVLQALKPQLSSIDGKSCMLVALALARLKYLPDKGWLCSFWGASIPLMPSCQQQQQPLHELKPSSGTWLSTSDGGQMRAGFNETELVILASSALELSKLTRPESKGPWSGQKPPVAWLDAITRASSGLLNTHTDLSTLLLWGEFMMRFSSMAGEHWPGPGAAWWQGFEAATKPQLQIAEPKELLRLLKALSTQQQHRPISPSWCTAFLAASRRVLLQDAASHLSACRYANSSSSSSSSSSSLQPAAQQDQAAPAEASDGASKQGQLKEFKGKAAATAGLRPLSRPSKGEGMSPTVQAAGVSAGAALSLRNLANLAKGVAELEMLPDSSWMEAWEVALELRSSTINRTVATALEHTRVELTRLAALSCQGK